MPGRCRILFSSLAILALSLSVAAADDGLVAHYPFDEGAGTAVRDTSGNGNNGALKGGVKWIKGAFGTALEFNGEDGYVECPLTASLAIAAGGTVMVWCRADPAQGGLVTWGSETGDNGIRLMLMVDTYHGGRNLMGCVGDSKTFRGFSGWGTLPTNVWTHVAYTFDGKNICVYRDGLLRATIPQTVQPNVGGVRFWIGRALAYGKVFFKGDMDEVRIYCRPVAAPEILAQYKADGAKRGRDMTLFSRPDVAAILHPENAKLVARLDVQAMQPLPAGAVIKVDLCKADTKEAVQNVEGRDIPKDCSSDVILDLSTVPAGRYVVRAAVAKPDGKSIGSESSAVVEWKGVPAAFKNIRILNNLCWELLNVPSAQEAKYSFSLPYDRWIFIQAATELGADGELWMDVDKDAQSPFAAITCAGAGNSVKEAMRYLRAGEHVLYVGRKGKANVKNLVVRAIPSLHHAYYGADPMIVSFGPYDWQFLSKDILPNTNVMVSGLDHYRRADGFERLPQWKQMGKSWIEWKPLPWEARSADDVLKVWRESSGYKNPLVDGFTVDEANGGDIPVYDALTAAAEQLDKDPAFKGKALYPYCDALWAGDRSTRFAQTVLKRDGWLLYERYFHEEPTAKDMDLCLYRYMVLPMAEWERSLPGSTPRIVITLSNASEPTRYNEAIYPHVDYKVCLDMQVRKLATDPAFFGLGGISWWHCGYSGEETVRWIGRLYRHYAIEGNTEPLDKDPYELPHLANPDFVDGTAGWTVQPAEAGGIRADKRAGYGYNIEGRFMGLGDIPVRADINGVGDTFLVCRRSAARPNVIRQELKALTPGRLYSFRTLTGDYQDLVQEKSNKQTHAVSITLADAEILPGAKNSFQFPLEQGRAFGKFHPSKNPYWLNFHYRVFRAKATTATLTISDWKSDAEPGGPVGQELMFNYIVVRPYLEP